MVNDSINVSLISLNDWTGSGLRMIEALQTHTVNRCRYFLLADNTFQPDELKFIQSSDVLIFKGDELPVISSDNKLHLYGKRNSLKTKEHNIFVHPEALKILLASGSGFRRRTKGEKWWNSLQWHNLQKYKNNTDVILTISPDIAYPEVNAIFLGHALDCEDKPFSWQQKIVPVIGCYPAKPVYADKKGVKKYLLPALKILQKEGYGFELQIIRNMTRAESIEAKRGCTLFFENINNYGCYGNSGIEAMQFGIPVIAHISEASMKQSGRNDYAQPILKVEKSVESLVKLLKDVFEERVDLVKIARETKQYCDKYHSYRYIAEKLDQLIRAKLHLK